MLVELSSFPEPSLRISLRIVAFLLATHLETGLAGGIDGIGLLMQVNHAGYQASPGICLSLFMKKRSKERIPRAREW